ncbi:MAG: hypothetical protein HQ567_01170 [Candidatus Nealsonbacteria bacterium]|nr:hypothetical protein [Candidatus Nealsonbacteria bacterium]
MTPAHPLQTELDAYKERRDELVAEHEGKFALFCGSEFVGVWDTYEDALQAGYTKAGLQPFLVKQIRGIEQIHFFSRDLTSCPS